MELKTPLNNGESSMLETKLDPPNPSNGEIHETQDTQETQLFFDDFDSNCSTPYVSAPSSPGRSGPVSGFFYSAPASPMHFALTTKSNSFASHQGSSFEKSSVSLGYEEFEFSARFGSSGSGSTGPMSSADELFLNGKIRPMKLSTHLEKPQALAPLLDLEPENGENEAELGLEPVRGRDLRFRDKSLRRRTRSMSPLRNVPFEWAQSEVNSDEKDCSFAEDLKGASLEEAKNGEEEEEEVETSATTTPSVSASSSRSSSAGRNSKRWVFLKDFLHRSKSEGRSNHKFWSTISFSTAKEKKPMKQSTSSVSSASKDPRFSNTLNLGSEATKTKGSGSTAPGKKPVAGKPTNGVGKRRMPPSLHELHYTANRAQAEEMRKKTYLPYRQGLLGCLGFSSKGYGAAMSTGFGRALNPVSSR